MTAYETGSHPDVVEEHVEEAAFLYAQRCHFLDLGRATWDRLRPVEARFEAHLDALVVAGPEAGGLVRGVLRSGAPGAAYVAARLACRADDVDGALALARSLDRPDSVVDALAHDAPPGWTGRLMAELESTEPRLLRTAVAVLGAGRGPAGDALLRAFAQAGGPDIEAELARALGLLRHPPARNVLARALGTTGHPAVARAIRDALVRYGDPDAIHGAGGQVHPRDALSLALSGHQRAGPLLSDAALTQDPGAVVALGVHGEPAHVPFLLDCLSDPELAAPGALGLRVLTGVPLVEEALVLDAPDDPDLGGDLVTRPSQSGDDWRAWWAEHGHSFPPGARVRAGRPFSPVHAVTSPVGGLADDLLPAPLRNALADELAGRYGLDAPFRADAFVVRQRAALDALAHAAADVRSQEGEWVVPRRIARRDVTR